MGRWRVQLIDGRIRRAPDTWAALMASDSRGTVLLSLLGAMLLLCCRRPMAGASLPRSGHLALCGAWTSARRMPLGTVCHRAQVIDGAPESLLVVLDLDETLVHASLFGEPGSAKGTPEEEFLAKLPEIVWQPRADFTAVGRGLVVNLTEEVPLHVSFRPGAGEFIRWLRSEPRVSVAVYTAGTRPYATQLLERLGLGDVVTLYRDDCVPFGLPIAKDLQKLRPKLSRVVLVDNSEKSFLLQPENGFLVSDWTGRDPGDRELERVREELSRLLDMQDVRSVLPALVDKKQAAKDKQNNAMVSAVAFVVAAVVARFASSFLQEGQ